MATQKVTFFQAVQMYQRASKPLRMDFTRLHEDLNTAIGESPQVSSKIHKLDAALTIPVAEVSIDETTVEVFRYDEDGYYVAVVDKTMVNAFLGRSCDSWGDMIDAMVNYLNYLPIVA